jgi:hypothetical protein
MSKWGAGSARVGRPIRPEGKDNTIPHDKYTQAYGETCLKCGKEERQHNSTWCTPCRTQTVQAHKQYVD